MVRWVISILIFINWFPPFNATQANEIFIYFQDGDTGWSMARELDIGSVRIYLSLVIYWANSLQLDSPYQQRLLYGGQTSLFLQGTQYLENIGNSVFIFFSFWWKIYLLFGICMVKVSEMFTLVILSSILIRGLFVRLISKIWLWAPIYCEGIMIYRRSFTRWKLNLPHLHPFLPFLFEIRLP